MSTFSTIKLLPEDPIFGLQKLFRQDPREKKVNLGIGVYKTEEGKSHLFSSVRSVEKSLPDVPHDYFPIEGEGEFIQKLQEVLFGREIIEKKKEQICGVQTLGGTGALSLFSLFAKKHLFPVIHLPQYTWANHISIFSSQSFSLSRYPYGAQSVPSTDLFEYLEKMPSKDAVDDKTPSEVILFHAACHNPTGVDSSREQWKEIIRIIREKHIFPLFDCAYQGFSQDIEADAFPVRHCIEENIACAVAYSCSKNFGLYGERLGALYFFSPEMTSFEALLSQLSATIRRTYSNPPRQGARIVVPILSSEKLRSSWISELGTLCGRIQSMRRLLADQLVNSLQSEKEQELCRFLAEQRGMFSLLPLSLEEVLSLRSKFGIYLLNNGRINVAGLSEKNVDYVASSIAHIINQRRQV